MAEGSVMRDSQDNAFIDCRDDIPLKESPNDDSLDEESREYPSTLQLVPILVGICLQSICIALVRGSTFQPYTIPMLTNVDDCRTTRSYQLQFRKSQSSSTPWKTFPGMPAHIFSQHAQLPSHSAEYIPFIPQNGHI